MTLSIALIVSDLLKFLKLQSKLIYILLSLIIDDFYEISTSLQRMEQMLSSFQVT